MGADRIKVEAQRDAFLRIARARPLNAIAELIWNSLDSDADNVTVYFDKNDLGPTAVVVEDDGDGATPEEAQEFYRRLGGSWKRPGARTKRKGRSLHGSQGQGRYKSLSVGRAIKWTYFYRRDDGIYEFSLRILGDDPSEVLSSEPRLSSRKMTGCIVVVEDFVHKFEKLDSDDAVLEITELFAIYLSDYPDVRVSYADQRLDPAAAISRSFSLSVPDVSLSSGEIAGGSELRILEWKQLDRRSLYICDARGFSLVQVPSRFQLKRRSFSAYLQSPYFDKLEQESRLDIAEMDPLGLKILNAAKDAIKDHYDEEDKSEASRLIQAWKASDIYPYSGETPQNGVEAVERQVFEIVAVKLQTAHSELSGAPKLAQKLQLELLRHAIETGPNQLRSILAKVVDLTRREQEDLAKLLEQTTLSSIIGASKVVADRLSFLRGLYQVVYEYQTQNRVKERTQLHRIVAQNSWLFGEEFAVSTDDQDLTAVLRAHKKYLNEDIVIDEPVGHVDQTRGIVDLMLSRLLRRHRPDEVEHLIIELKRPGVSVGQAEIGQIEKYAASIERDGRFGTQRTIVWNYWVLSDSLDEMAKWRVLEDKTGRGLIRNTDRSRIYVKTWSELINDAKARYQFIQEKLDINASDARAMKFLREEYASLLSGVSVSGDTADQA